MQHRRLTILFAVITLFAFGVIVWYFLFSSPNPAPTIEGTVNPSPSFSLPGRLGFIFGNDEPPTQTTETEVTQAGQEPFIRVWDKPSTGNTFVNRQILKEVVATTTAGTTTVTISKTVRATTTTLLFVDRVTGYVYGHNIDSGTTYQISNTTIPGVYDAYIFSGGDKVIMRYLDSDRKTILSVLANIPNVQEGRDPQPLTNVSNLPQNITSVAVNQNTSLVSYLVLNDLGSSVYTISAKGTAKVADSPFSEWSLFYGGDTLYANSKPSAYVEGTTVVLPSFSRIVGEKTGLLSIASSQGTLLSSMWSQSGLLLFSSKSGKLKTVNVKTLASKCSASGADSFICGVPFSVPDSDEGLPDDWYQGKASFEDRLMLIDASAGFSADIYSFGDKYGSIDVTHIQTGQGGDIVSFIRKQDGALFLLKRKLLNEQ